MTQEYHISLEIFEGPLDLLLYLVAKDEVDIKDIEVARVCAQFLEYLELMKELNVEIAGEYLVMAATLTRLKARELLPQEETSELLDDGELIDREQLIQQLIEYKKYKEAARTLQRFELEQKGTYYKAKAEKVEWAEEFEEANSNVTVFDLLSAFKGILEQRIEEPLHAVNIEEVKIDDRIEFILSQTEDKPQIKFEDLFPKKATRMTIVVTFMAMLELIKMEYLVVRQTSMFGQIWIYRKGKEELEPQMEEGEASE